MSDTLGSQLRTLRLEHGCTLSELARLSGVGKGTISELENDRRGARLSTLFALTTALEAPLSALLPAPHEHGEAVAGEAVEAFLMGRWSTADGLVEAYRAVIGTTGQNSQPHGPRTEETVTVVRGRVRVGDQDDVRTLTAGESHRYDGARPHQFSALDEPADVVLLMHYPTP